MSAADQSLSAQHLDLVRHSVDKRRDPHQAIKVWVFGSRAAETHKPYSDLDLLLEATPSLSPRQLALIRDDLEESNLPYRVDIVADHELAADLRSEIHTARRLVFESK